MRCARNFAEPPSLPWPQNPVGSDVLAAQRIFCSFRDPDERCARGFAATALQRIEVEMGSAYPDQCIRCVFFRCVRRPLRSAACPRRSASSSQRLRRTPRARHKRLHCLSCLLRASNRHRIQIQVVDGREQGRMAGPDWPGMYTISQHRLHRQHCGGAAHAARVARGPRWHGGRVSAREPRGDDVQCVQRWRR